MPHEIEQVLLRPGDSVTFTDRDDLLEKLDSLSRKIPGRKDGVSPEGQALLGEIPWPDVTGMRHRLIHAYFSTSLEARNPT